MSSVCQSECEFISVVMDMNWVHALFYMISMPVWMRVHLCGYGYELSIWFYDHVLVDQWFLADVFSVFWNWLIYFELGGMNCMTAIFLMFIWMCFFECNFLCHFFFLYFDNVPLVTVTTVIYVLLLTSRSTMLGFRHLVFMCENKYRSNKHIYLCSLIIYFNKCEDGSGMRYIPA